ncbi:MAG: nucleotide exchange factor GrpE [Gemmataceae bacterium]
MSESAPPGDVRRTSEGRGLLTPEQIEAALADFRAWLTELTEPPPEPPEDDTEPVDLATVVAAFTALRHEVNLQTKATRALGEQVAQRLAEPPRETPASGDDDAVKSLLKTLVDVYDALAIAMREVEKPRPTPAGWLARWRMPPLADAVAEGLLSGYRLSLQRIDRALSQYGLEPIATDGVAFDPELMEAVEAVASDKPSGTVIGDVRRGYRRGGRVFRYAQVRVAR